MRTREWVVVAATTALLLSPSVAYAHGETATTDPDAGASLNSAPGTVSVDLTEPPAKGARFEVLDGCNDVVSQGSEVKGNTLSTKIGESEPGNWRATYQVVSAADGHVTRDRFDFAVKGATDCSAGTPTEENSGNGGDDGDSGGPRAGGPDEEDNDDSSIPWIPIGLGTAVLVGGALLIRARSA